MHEVGLMQTALELALEQARRQGARQVHRLGLRVGPLAGADPEALALAFEVVVVGTAAEGAELSLEATPILCRCGCGHDFEAVDVFRECPRCGRPGAPVQSGAGLELAYIEVS
jgi:hydrogenase nickel incorporation protein HypA/HybF